MMCIITVRDKFQFIFMKLRFAQAYVREQVNSCVCGETTRNLNEVKAQRGKKSTTATITIASKCKNMRILQICEIAASISNELCSIFYQFTGVRFFLSFSTLWSDDSLAHPCSTLVEFSFYQSKNKLCTRNEFIDTYTSNIHLKPPAGVTVIKWKEMIEKCVWGHMEQQNSEECSNKNYLNVSIKVNAYTSRCTAIKREVISLATKAIRWITSHGGQINEWVSKEEGEGRPISSWQLDCYCEFAAIAELQRAREPTTIQTTFTIYICPFAKQESAHQINVNGHFIARGLQVLRKANNITNIDEKIQIGQIFNKFLIDSQILRQIYAQICTNNAGISNKR